MSWGDTCLRDTCPGGQLSWGDTCLGGQLSGETNVGGTPVGGTNVTTPSKAFPSQNILMALAQCSIFERSFGGENEDGKEFFKDPLKIC